jgi:hypothetical protein
MPTPPAKRASTISHLTAGTRQPYSIDASAILRISASGRPPLSGVKPTSCIILNATTNMAASTTPRSTKGAPRLTCAAMKPPATEPVSIPAPVTIWPRPKTVSISPVNSVAASASTSQASTAPEKNVKPSPSSIDAIAHSQNGASICHSST